MNVYDLIEKKRDGGELSWEELNFLISDYTGGSIPDYQMSAFAMAVYFRGMTERETVWLTRAMTESGDQLDLGQFGNLSVDKHSTGGVGDKTTLVVAPLVASLGGKLAKMTGRGLGHTGGTVDKLESIPGINVALDQKTLLRQVREIGIAVTGQSPALAPADKKLYALRDVTATVDSMPLIVSSIMSKKLAAGSKNIVLDVTLGSGSFNKTLSFARELARQMISIGEHCGRNMAAVITNMDEPLGRFVGNALEVQECIRLMQGADIPDLREVCLTLAANMLMLCQGWSYQEAWDRAETNLNNGAAYETFRRWIACQGGDVRCFDTFSLFPQAEGRYPLLSPASGFLTHMDTQTVGRVSTLLGAGRETMEDTIDYGAGLQLLKKPGEAVTAGQPLAILYTSRPHVVEEAKQRLLGAITFGPEAPAPLPTVYEVLHGTGQEA